MPPDPITAPIVEEKEEPKAIETPVKPTVETPTSESKVEDPPKVDVAPDKSAEAISQINQTLAKQTEILNTLSQKVDAKSTEKDWTVEQCEEALAKVESGEYEAKWRVPLIKKMTTLIAKQEVDSKAKEFYSEAAKNDFKAKWENGIAQAANIFGKDVGDPQSPLFKTAQTILMQDPTWQAYQKTGDTKYIDPNLQLKCFELAHSRLVRQEKDAPKVPSKGSPKTGLGGPSLPKPDIERAAKLEEIATADPNNQQAWLALMKEGINKNRAKA